MRKIIYIQWLKSHNNVSIVPYFFIFCNIFNINNCQFAQIHADISKELKLIEIKNSIQHNFQVFADFSCMSTF